MYKTVFILGAGASADAGCPTMDQFLDKSRELLSVNSLGIENINAFEEVFKAIYDLQGVHYKSNLNLNNIEEVLGAIDMARLIKRLGDNEGDLQYLYDSILRLIMVTLDLCTELYKEDDAWKLKGSYHDFVDILSFVNKCVDLPHYSVISFNYDVALDYAMQKKLGNFSYGLEGARSANNIFKLHGSLNWGWCDKCGKVIVRPLKEFFIKNTNQIQFVPGKRLPIRMTEFITNYEHEPGHILKAPVLVPPTWTKGDHYKAIWPVWQKAAKALSEAEAIYVIGYSLPETDMFFKYLFALGTHSKSSIRRFWVFDPDPTGGVEKRFKRLLGPGVDEPRFKFHKYKFQVAVQALQKQIYDDLGAIKFF